MTRRLFLVRHGETVGESSIRFHGKTDVALADEGRTQVSRLIPRLAAERFAAVITSPLSRARSSADLLVAAFAEPPSVVEVEDDFRELDFGTFEGMTIDEIEAAQPDWFAIWQAGEADSFPGGDSIAGFRARVADAFRRLVTRHRDGDLLVVAHKGTLKAGLMALCGYDPAEIRSWDMDLGSLWVLEAGEPWILRESNVVG